jgi:hypothetical protein
LEERDARARRAVDLGVKKKKTKQISFFMIFFLEFLCFFNQNKLKDLYQEEQTVYAGTVPQMTTIGNHEQFANATGVFEMLF